MELNLKGTWIQTADGRWANLHHCDLAEVVFDKDRGCWVARAWNALQPHVDAYVLAESGDRESAESLLAGLFDRIAAGG